MKKIILSLALVLSLSACATQQNSADIKDGVYDPLEGVNRVTFEFNRYVDNLVLKPVAYFYRDVPPPPVRDRVNRFLMNLDEPVVMANTFLQGDVEQGFVSMMRFLINSTVGLAGMFDVATDWGFEYREEDFGQTLAVWGVEPGPYIVLPILGPSNTRDSVGRLADAFMDPWNEILAYNDEDEWITGRAVAAGINTRSKYLDALEDLEQNSLDFYATLRSSYMQRRDYKIENKGKGDNGYAPVKKDPEKVEPMKKPTKADAETPEQEKLALLLTESADTLLLTAKDLPEQEQQNQ